MSQDDIVSYIMLSVEDKTCLPRMERRQTGFRWEEGAHATPGSPQEECLRENGRKVKSRVEVQRLGQPCCEAFRRSSSSLGGYKTEEMGQNIGGGEGSVFWQRPVMSPCWERHKGIRTLTEEEAEGGQM